MINNKEKRFLFISSYLLGLRQQEKNEKVLSEVGDILIKGKFKENVDLDLSEYNKVLFYIGHFVYLLYEISPETRIYARYYMLMLTKELAKYDSTCLANFLFSVYKYDKDGWVLALTYVPTQIRNKLLFDEKVKVFIADAVKGTICGIIISAVIFVVRSIFNI